ncbi:MAG: hypothetical protein ACM3JJ_10800 [Hyphomicrobiales bacterium]
MADRRGTRVAGSVFDPWIRLLGANPAVFRPMFRAHLRMAERRARLMRGRNRGLLAGLTPFQTRCVMTFGIGVMTAASMAAASSALVGAIVVLTLGAGFLLLIVALDYFDLLVDRNEYLVIAAHPHDDWSVLLAKLAVFTRNVMILATCLFLAPAGAAAFSSRSAGAGIAFLLGGYGLALTIAWGAVLLTAFVVAAGGRNATDRVLPWAQTLYLALYFGFFSSRRFLSHLTVPSMATLGALPWLLPPAWFAGPFEIASGRGSAAAFGRAGLALASMCAVVAVGAGWIGRRFGPAMLEPVSERAPGRGRAKAAPRRRTPVARRGRGTPATRAFRTLFWAHIKSDHVFRMQFVTMLFIPAMILISSLSSGIRHGHELALPMLAFVGGMMLLIGMSATGRSSRPPRLAFLLASPVDLHAFAMAPAGFLRMAMLVPATAVLAGVAALWSQGPVTLRILSVLGAVLVLEDTLVFLRGFTPTIPFSQSFKSARRTGWLRLALGFYMFLVLGFSILLLALAPLVGVWGYLAFLLLFGLVRAGLGPWVRRRVAKEVAAFEPGALTV